MAVEKELELRKQVTKTEEIANNIVIANDNDYEYAAEQVKVVKGAVKTVEEYWEPMRLSAYGAYQSVLEHKKEMIDPLKNAEKIIKTKISGYLKAKEEERRRKEEELRRLAMIEAEKKMAEAMEAEVAGDVTGAEIAMEEAVIMESVAETAVVYKQEKSVKGVSKTKAWQITSIDAENVPISLSGMTLRPVDEKAVMRLIKASGGTVNIPGIKYEETVNVRVRA